MKTSVESASATEPGSQAVTWGREPATIVCLGLVLAMLVLGIRIVSVL